MATTGSWTKWAPQIITGPVRASFRPAALKTKAVAVAGAVSRYKSRGGPVKVTSSIRLRFTGDKAATLSGFAPVFGGSKPHEISPKAGKRGGRAAVVRKGKAKGTAKALGGGAAKIAGHPVASVNHPGTKGNPAISQAGQAFPKILGTELGRLLSKAF